MTDTGTVPDYDDRWAIVRDGESGTDTMYLSDDQEWGPIDTAMRFATRDDATNGAQTLCPPFMPGHAEELDVPPRRT